MLLCVSGRGDKDVAQVSEMGELPDIGPLPEVDRVTAPTAIEPRA